MWKRIESLILGLFLMIIGVFMVINKVIPQGKRETSGWDVSDKPYIAYIIGGIFFIYGVYLFIYWLKRPKHEEKKIEIKEEENQNFLDNSKKNMFDMNNFKNSIPDMNGFTVVMFFFIAFPTLVFFYYIIKMILTD